MGITLRRRVETGIVFIYEIIPESQAVQLDVKVDDELWGVGSTEIGDTPLDKDAWNGLIQYIKQSPRPLKMVLKRNIITLKPAPPVNVDNTTRKDSKVDLEQEKKANSKELSVDESENVNAATKEVTKSDSKQLNELKKFLSKYPTKEKETGAAAKLTSIVQSVPLIQQINNLKKTSSCEYMVSNLIEEGRKVLKSGELSIKASKTAIWNFNTQSSRNIVLFNDILMISIPIQNGEKYQIEDIVNLKTCKLRGELLLQ